MSWLDDLNRRVLRWAALSVILGWLAAGIIGCGPIRSTSRIGKAEVAYERARVNDAYQKAPYEFFSARYYLHKAKEEWGYSNFEAADDYAKEAARAAESAVREAKEDPWSDPIEGRNKSYQLGPRETITADPEDIDRIEDSVSSDEDDRDDEADDGESPDSR